MPRSRRRSELCDCGRARTGNRAICDRCAWLDGRSRGEFRVVMSMRSAPWHTVREISDDTGMARETVMRALRRLEARGRVRRHIPGAYNSEHHFALVDSWCSPNAEEVSDGFPA